MSTTKSNFAKLGTIAVAGKPNAVAQIVVSFGATILDKFAVDLAVAGWVNGATILSLSASTPQTVDLTSFAGAGAQVGDTTFALANDLIFTNLGSQPVIVSPGSSNPFSGPIAGTSPTFTIPGNAKIRWHNPTGWTVDSTHKTLKFDPGGSSASIALSVGGS